MRSASPTWSVYDGEWNYTNLQDSSKSCLFVNTVAQEHTLKGCGLKKRKLLQRGAQGVVYEALDTTRLDESGQPSQVAVKRLYTQRNDFGAHGVGESVLREATLLFHINSMQRKMIDSQSKCAGDTATSQTQCTIGEDARIVQLYRIVEAPHNELCLVMELAALDLRHVVIENAKKTVAAAKSIPPCAPVLHSGGVEVGEGGRADVPDREGSSCTNSSHLSLVRYLLRRLLRIVVFLHEECGVVHRDIKLSNVLVLEDGALRLSDFGSARSLLRESHDILGKTNEFPSVEYTPASVCTTLLYQPPECLLGDRGYSTTLDMWTLGVVFAELVLQRHLFSAKSELGMVSAIWKLLGQPPSEAVAATHFSVDETAGDSAICASHGTLALKFPSHVLPPDGLDLLRKMLSVEPCRRISARAALEHPFLAYDGADEDDTVGGRLWMKKVHAALAEVEEVKVCMPSLKLLEMMDDDSDDDLEGSPGLCIRLH